MASGHACGRRSQHYWMMTSLMLSSFVLFVCVPYVMIMNSTRSNTRERSHLPCTSVEVAAFGSQIQCQTETSRPFLIVMDKPEQISAQKTSFSSSFYLSRIWEKRITNRIERVLSKAHCHAERRQFISVGGASLGYYSLLAASHGFKSMTIALIPKDRDNRLEKMQMAFQRASIARNSGFSELMSVYRIGHSETANGTLCMDPATARSTPRVNQEGNVNKSLGPCGQEMVPVASLSALVRRHEQRLPPVIGINFDAYEKTVGEKALDTLDLIAQLRHVSIHWQVSCDFEIAIEH